VSGLREGVLAGRAQGAPSVTDLVCDGARELSSYLGFADS
jgi:hypothetical protein